MYSIRRCMRTTLFTAFASTMMATFSMLPQSVSAGSYAVTRLVADEEGVARFTDPTLINPWGLAIAPNGELVVAVNGSDKASFFNPNGSKSRFDLGVPSAPTGVAINNFSQDFRTGNRFSNGFMNGFGTSPTDLIFATEEGTILAANVQNGQSNAVVVVDNSQSEAVYKGVAIGPGNVGGRPNPIIYAADFRNRKVDMFNRNFQSIGSFTDPTVPAGFAPFNVAAAGNLVLVSFAKQLGPENEDDEAGPGNGFVDLFSANGASRMRLISRGRLNSPWAMVISPNNFGKFSNALLVGNFGDGRINAFDLRTGKFLGQLTNGNGQPIVIEGLWGLAFPRGSSNLYFASGPGEESHGLIGFIRPVK